MAGGLVRILTCSSNTAIATEPQRLCLFCGTSLQRKMKTFTVRSQARFISTSVVRGISVTLDTIFSRQNELRVRTSLLTVRPVRKPSHPGSRRRLAAVLVPLCTVNGEPSVLFTLRSTHLNSHSGHVSFPGGKKDDSDRNLVHTALREAEEELGLPESLVDIWGELLPSPSRNNLTVTPVIGFCGELDMDILKPNLQEDPRGSEEKLQKIYAKLLSPCSPEQYLPFVTPPTPG